MTQESDDSLREAREFLERHDPPLDEGEVASLKRMGKTVTLIREQRGMAREELAPKCEMTVPELKRIESGKMSERWGDLGKVAKGLEMGLDELFREYEERAPSPGAEGRS